MCCALSKFLEVLKMEKVAGFEYFQEQLAQKVLRSAVWPCITLAL